MTREEAKDFLIDISYKLGNMAVEYLTEKDGEKMREAIKALEQEPTSPCDVCRYNPPSSTDGKACCMCPAESEVEDGSKHMRNTTQSN